MNEPSLKPALNLIIEAEDCLDSAEFKIEELQTLWPKLDRKCGGNIDECMTHIKQALECLSMSRNEVEFLQSQEQP